MEAYLNSLSAMRWSSLVEEGGINILKRVCWHLEASISRLCLEPLPSS